MGPKPRFERFEPHHAAAADRTTHGTDASFPAHQPSQHTNHLSTLPPEIGNLTTLRSLYLHENKLHTLPPEIAQLTSLTSLFLDFNELNTLPPEIGRLARLERLTLANNALTKLPESLVDLRSLEVLILHGNKALGLPIELLGPRYVESRDTAPPADPEAILDFYFSRQAEGEEPMREVRLLLVGRGRVGKTSLLKALRGESADKQEPETPGINVLPLDLNCAHGTATGHVWDFGG